MALLRHQHGIESYESATRVQQRLGVDSGGSLRLKVAARGPGGKVDAPELSSGPVCEIQEVSRV
eukprot:COSAG04_NODE_14307_length_573_cov_0.945148_1_plen_63_part_10